MPDEIYLAWLKSLGRDFVSVSGNGGVQTQQFARFNHPHDHGFPPGRGHGQFHAPFAEHVHSTRHLAFDKQDSPGWIQACKFHFLEICQGFGGHLAKKSIFSYRAGCAVICDFHPVRCVGFHFGLLSFLDSSEFPLPSSSMCRRKLEAPFRTTPSFRIRRRRSSPLASTKLTAPKSTFTSCPCAMFVDVSHAFRNSSTQGPLT